MHPFIQKLFGESSFRPTLVGRYEGLLLRFFFALLVVDTIWSPIHFTDQPLPKGLGHFINFGFLADPSIFQGFRVTLIVLALAYTLGLALAGTLPLLAFAHIAYHTLYNSQGPTHHDHQMISLALLAQSGVALWPIYHRLRHREPYRFRGGLTMNSFLLYSAQAAVASVYVTSAITKLSKSKGLWLFKSHEFSKSLVKTDRQRYYSTLDDKYGGAVPAAEWISEHPHIARLFFAGGFFTELFAFLALANRKWAFFIGIALITMHQGVQRLMNLEFHENQWMAVLFLLCIPYWIGRVANRSQAKPALAPPSPGG